MIRVTITAEAYRALGGSDEPPPPQWRWQLQREADDYYLWLTPMTLSALNRARRPGESCSDAILRMAASEEVA